MFADINMYGLHEMGGELYEVKHYELRIKGVKYAHIQVLCFGDGKYGWQARIINDFLGDEYISDRTKHRTTDEALQLAIKSIANSLITKGYVT